LYNKRWKSHCC